jgi:hypothetical protein
MTLLVGLGRTDAVHIVAVWVCATAVPRIGETVEGSGTQALKINNRINGTATKERRINASLGRNDLYDSVFAVVLH